jgi:hypothetical protein
MKFLNILGGDVEIVIRHKPSSRRNGKTEVTGA